MLGLEGLRLIFSIRTRGSSDTLEILLALLPMSSADPEERGRSLAEGTRCCTAARPGSHSDIIITQTFTA